MLQLPHDIDEEEFLAWLDHPVTKLVMQFCNASRFELMNSWAANQLKWEENARAIGQAETYGELLALNFEQLQGRLKE